MASDKNLILGAAMALVSGIGDIAGGLAGGGAFKEGGLSNMFGGQ